MSEPQDSELTEDADLGEDRVLAEDLATPVEIEPGKDDATPAGWDWRRTGTSQPNAATYHMSHSDVGRILVDVLTPADSPEDTPFVVSQDIPIIIMDSLDKYWAGESRTKLPLEGIRVPVADDTLKGSKRALAADLAAQLRLLLLLSSSRKGGLAPQLQSNLDYLRSVLTPREKEEGKES
ncbi:MAG: hypothetical protein BZY80_05705 [SAR202 cluster bacterium Io17-Chloro-G2]|nr:MAG: hypothetical protein BZY80_05705 [SAR202 cluster bacterium Io17-Chloro-G2]